MKESDPQSFVLPRIDGAAKAALAELQYDQYGAGRPGAVAAYYDEHVEADAVHEQLAIRSICGAFVDDEPELANDVLFGAACCLRVEELAGEALVVSWEGADEPEYPRLRALA